ncbi:hypothetical protein ASPSYDRAFT_41219 [Aspergillus sydowii CBS 593.65]|uniref:FAD synthase n=1 Tax=Aspergillus sydowii CBS 593.65 TaxID=1036612 RepID=A0A1L9TTD5_9EURO|nr:uncharacterized protein ASPSYDRAFT_41219 [Aspergillus sydowii CBS 593.65]OJJ62543.1 hypothetical protein ASPSYDRAFT_41219 [Aspergillus sydowii CBS 593.65]
MLEAVRKQNSLGLRGERGGDSYQNILPPTPRTDSNSRLPLSLPLSLNQDCSHALNAGSIDMTASPSASVGPVPPKPPALTTADTMSSAAETQPPHSHLPQSIPSKHATSLTSVITSCHTRVQAFLAESHEPDSLLSSVQNRTRTSLNIIDDALQKYSLDEIALSYNGGKDCLVLLILFLAALNSKLPIDETKRQSIPAMYVAEADPFTEMEDFVNWSKQIYHLDLARYTKNAQTTLRSGFEDYLDRNPSVKAIFVGMRRTDPHGTNLTNFDPTDSGWPDFMRIHPVVDWRYAEIWAFLRHLQLEYCSLYDKGYTSLGGLSNTHQNPSLWDPVKEEYGPAYELIDDNLERSGRY